MCRYVFCLHSSSGFPMSGSSHHVASEGPHWGFVLTTVLDAAGSCDVSPMRAVASWRHLRCSEKSHRCDQSEMCDHQILLWYYEGCAGMSSGEYRDGMEHKQCRTDLLKLYKKHITACRSLDNWVWEWHREVLLVGTHHLELWRLVHTKSMWTLIRSLGSPQRERESSE